MEDNSEQQLERRKAALAHLGGIMAALGGGKEWPGHGCGLTQEEYQRLERAMQGAVRANGWYTMENVRHAFAAWGMALRPEALDAWLARYPQLGEQKCAKVGLILAGNIPLVGLHDVICTWLAGHQAMVKPSSQEPELIPALVKVLDVLHPGTADRIQIIPGKLGDVDAMIATGSNNTARYFEHYFGHLPRIVRRNRVSVAVLDGTESEAELTALGEDVFRYFGLGCRNVSKLFLPESFDLDRIFTAWYPYHEVVQHNKYANNYDYTRAIWLLDQIPFLENGFVLLKEDKALASPVGAVFYERYADKQVVEQRLKEHATEIQCVVGHDHLPFGTAQKPGLADYADGVDTMRFLLELPQGQYS